MPVVKEMTIDEFFRSGLPLADVRSPGEFARGHISGAVNIPLFNDDERARVGIVYTHESAGKALELGYSIVNPKLHDFIDSSRRISREGRIAVHCWRGGLRSRAFAGHLSENGFREVYMITGGYKAFRNHVLTFFNTPFRLRIVGGYTGSGKTEILHLLQDQGNQVVDLEGIASHKGSSFGGLGEKEQPTQEQFENDLFETIRNLDVSETIWVEDESHNIGGVNIPVNFFNQMKKSPVYFLEIPREIRAEYLVNQYAGFEKGLIAESLSRIARRLGGQHFKSALLCLQKEEYYELTMLVLNYYDKKYLNGLKLHDEEKVVLIRAESADPLKNATIILSHNG